MLAVSCDANGAHASNTIHIYFSVRFVFFYGYGNKFSRLSFDLPDPARRVTVDLRASEQLLHILHLSLRAHA